MKPEKIRELLEEAADYKCSYRRRNEIQCILGKATAGLNADGVHKIEGRGAGIHLVLDFVYVSTIQNRLSHLPKLLPLFLALCSDREETMLSDIDWKIVE